MGNSKLIEKEIGETFEIFQKLILNDRNITIKKIEKNRFKLISSENFGNLNAIEKEYFFISGQFIEKNEQTLIQYRVRGNATFRVLSFVIALMSLPTLFLGLKGDKSSTEWKTVLINNILIYLSIVILSMAILLYQEKKMKRKGEKLFNDIILNSTLAL